MSGGIMRIIIMIRKILSPYYVLGMIESTSHAFPGW
jgi:hypothetical protein